MRALWKWAGGALLAVAVAPIITATWAGLESSGNPNGQRLYDGMPDASRDADLLVSTYERREMIKLGSHLNSFIPYSEYAFASCRGDLANLKDAAYEDSSELEDATIVAADRTRVGWISGKVEAATTPFGRGFDTSCLQTPGYRNICKLWIDPVMDEVGRQATPLILADEKRAFAAMDHVACAYAEKVKGAAHGD